MNANHLAQQFFKLGKFIEAADRAGLLDSPVAAIAPAAAPSPPPPAPAESKPAKVKATKSRPEPQPEPAKRGRKPGAHGTKSQAVREFFAANPGASAAAAARHAGCVESMASRIRASITAGQREGESNPATPEAEAGDGDDDEDGGTCAELVQLFEYFRHRPRASAATAARKLNLPIAVAVYVREEIEAAGVLEPPLDDEISPPTVSDDGEILPLGRQLLAAAERVIAKRGQESPTKEKNAKLAERIRELPYTELTLEQVAERIGWAVSRINRVCRDHGLFCRGMRPTKPIDDPYWELPAELVETAEPERHREMQKLIYEIRAPAVREKMRAMRIKKANCYPVSPIVLDRLNARELFPSLTFSDRR